MMVAAVATPIAMIGPIAPKPQSADFATPVASLSAAPAPATIASTSVAAPAPVSDRPASLSALVDQKLAADTSGDEHECLAASVYFESKGQPYKGQLAVAETIINRTESGRFPASVCGVVKQRGQFGFVRGGRFPSIQRAGKQWHEAVAIAAIAMKKAWTQVANKALYFNTGRRPGPNLIRVASYGPQVFYR